ncbi:type I DNA topoisomerase [candidate division WOR-3 bacterium]|nr:type I DNA topoisomerase [candidate division WOR-3 bacterium]
MPKKKTKTKAKKKKSTAKKIIIVESPTKCKTIKGFLSNDYALISSRGHIKDLPKSMLGVDIENNFKPRYIKIRGKAKLIREIVTACKNAREIFLAPDPDREGEAIAQHLAEELNPNGQTVKRALFYEITPEHVRNALAHTTTINENLVNAHKARRILDRIVGYYTSPLLWSIIKSGLSAGRVQSVALRLVCEREQEISAFTPTPYWTADAEFVSQSKPPFSAGLFQINGENRKIMSVDELKRLQGLLVSGTQFSVTSYRVTNPKRMPPPPFITSTLQQEASKRFKYPARKTMFIAQSLYEGVHLPQGRIGLITYMRTDSTRVNSKALGELRQYISGKYGEEYCSKSTREFKDRKGAQGGHEAIRPTKITLEPDTAKPFLTDEQFRIYTLVFNRYVASQMAPASYKKKEAIVSYQDVDFKSEEQKPLFLGYQLVSGDVVDKGFVPDMNVGEPATLNTIEFTEKHTEPSPRYTEATLIKKLEENGIGRPSTYAHILQTLFDRGYATKQAGKIKASELGMQVYDIIIPRFSNIFEVNYTAKMEKRLDQIEIGNEPWQQVVKEFYDPFIITLNKTKQEAEEIKESITEKVNKNCPKCHQPLVVRWGRYGKFLACSGFPDCKYSENLEIETSDKKCPKCGRALIIRHGKFGKFLACSGYPDCRYTENIPHDAPCPMCNGEMIIVNTRRGKMYKCKKCDFTTFYAPVHEKCPKCGKGMVMKRGKVSCPACDIKHKKK